MAEDFLTPQSLGPGTRALARGGLQLESSLAGLIAALASLQGLKGLQRAATTHALEKKKEAIQYAPEEPVFPGIADPGRFGTWALESAGEMAPGLAATFLSTIATGGLGPAFLSGAVGKKAVEKGVQQLVARGIPQVAAKKAMEKQLAQRLGAKVGMMGATAAMEGGQTYNELMERGLDKPLTALATGLASGAVELVGGNKRIIDKFVPKQAKEAFERALRKGDTKLIKNFLKEGAIQMMGEAGQEYVQTGISQVPLAVYAGEGLLTPQKAAERSEAARRGGLMGFVTGGVTGGVGARRARKTLDARAKKAQDTAANLLAENMRAQHDAEEAIYRRAIEEGATEEEARARVAEVMATTEIRTPRLADANRSLEEAGLPPVEIMEFSREATLPEANAEAQAALQDRLATLRAERDYMELAQERGIPIPGYEGKFAILDKIGQLNTDISFMENSDVRVNPTPTKRAPVQTAVPESDWKMRARTWLVNSLTRLGQYQKATEAAGPRIDVDVIGAETRRRGMTQEKLDRLEDEYMRPMFQDLAEAGLTLDELNTFMQAKFAQHRNAQVFQIHPAFAQGYGSGMPDRVAFEKLVEFAAARKTKGLEKAAAHIYRMQRDIEDYMVETNLMSRDEVNTMREAGGEFYVPLWDSADQDVSDYLADMKADWGSPAKGGLEVKGREAKSFTGRITEPKNVITSALQQAGQRIIRGEQNRVMQSFGRMVAEYNRQNPQDRTFRIEPEETKAVFNPATGTVTRKRVGPERVKDAITFKFEGRDYRIQVNDPYVRSAIKGMVDSGATGALRKFGAVTRWLAAMNTQYNPEFIMSNMLRDWGTAYVHARGLYGPGEARKIIKSTPQAMRAVYRAGRGKEPVGEWGEAYRQYRKHGGEIAFYNLREIDSTIKRLSQRVEKGKLDDPGRIRAFTKFVSDANKAVENGTRLAVFKHAVDKGMSPDQAAVLAKNITVNFERAGSAGRFISSLWMFANANIQGTARLYKAFADPATRRSTMAFTGKAFLTGLSLAMLNKALAGEDESGQNRYDKISPHEKEANWIIYDWTQPEKNKYYKVPMPYGYNVFPMAGYYLADLITGSKTPMAAAGGMVAGLANAFSPLGAAASQEPGLRGAVRTAGKIVSPSVFDPFLAIMLNEKWHGGPILPEMKYGAPVPQSEKYFRTVSPEIKEFTTWLSRASGGQPGVPGKLEISPEIVEHLIESILGGLGRFGKNVETTLSNTMRDEKLALRTTPFVRRFAGEAYEWQASREFMAARDLVQQYQRGEKILRDTGRTEELKQFRQRNFAFLKGGAVGSALRHKEAQLRGVQKRLDFIRRRGDPKGADKEEVRSLRTRQDKLQKEFIKVFLREKRRM